MRGGVKDSADLDSADNWIYLGGGEPTGTHVSENLVFTANVEKSLAIPESRWEG